MRALYYSEKTDLVNLTFACLPQVQLNLRTKKWLYFLLFFLEIINICLSSGFIILFVP